MIRSLLTATQFIIKNAYPNHFSSAEPKLAFARSPHIAIIDIVTIKTAAITKPALTKFSCHASPVKPDPASGVILLVPKTALSRLLPHPKYRPQTADQNNIRFNFFESKKMFHPALTAPSNAASIMPMR